MSNFKCPNCNQVRPVSQKSGRVACGCGKEMFGFCSTCVASHQQQHATERRPAILRIVNPLEGLVINLKCSICRDDKATTKEYFCDVCRTTLSNICEFCLSSHKAVCAESEQHFARVIPPKTQRQRTQGRLFQHYDEAKTAEELPNPEGQVSRRRGSGKLFS